MPRFLTLVLTLTFYVFTTSSGSSKTQEFPRVMATILLEKQIPVTAKALEAAAKAHGLKGVTVSNAKGHKDSFIVIWQNRPFIVLNRKHPVPMPTFQDVLQGGFGLQNAPEIVNKQKAHIIVGSLDKTTRLGQSISTAVGTTELAAAFSRFEKPLGYYWNHAETLLDVRQFESYVLGMRRAMQLQKKGQNGAGAHLPSVMWVGFRLERTSQKGKLGAYSKGLAAFTGYELHITPVALKPETLAKRIYGTITYLFLNGPILKNGQTLGISKDEHFRLKWKPASGKQPANFFLTLEK